MNLLRVDDWTVNDGNRVPEDGCQKDFKGYEENSTEQHW